MTYALQTYGAETQKQALKWAQMEPIRTMAKRARGSTSTAAWLSRAGISLATWDRIASGQSASPTVLMRLYEACSGGFARIEVMPSDWWICYLAARRRHLARALEGLAHRRLETENLLPGVLADRQMYVSTELSRHAQMEEGNGLVCLHPWHRQDFRLANLAERQAAEEAFLAGGVEGEIRWHDASKPGAQIVVNCRLHHQPWLPREGTNPRQLSDLSWRELWPNDWDLAGRAMTLAALRVRPDYVAREWEESRDLWTPPPRPQPSRESWGTGFMGVEG